MDQPEAQVSWLFTFSADAEVADTDGITYLTLANIDSVLAITSHPRRMSTAISPQVLVAMWLPLGFGADPPNASIAGQDADPQAVVLSDPAVTTDNKVRFRIGKVDSGLAGAVVVTIDGGAVNQQVTDSVTETNVKVLGAQSAQALSSNYDVMNTGLWQAGTRSEDSVSTDQVTPVPSDSSIGEAAENSLSLTGGQGVPGAKTPTTSSIGAS